MWETIGDFIGQVGFPVFAATYFMLKTGPELKKLREAITALTVVTAKSNGMSALDVDTIYKLVKESKNRGRRVEDQIRDGFDGLDKEP